MDGAWRALAQLRDEGVIKAVGMGVNEWQVCHAALQEADFDCFLLAGRYTLLEQEALQAFLPLCEERNAAVVIGGDSTAGYWRPGRLRTRNITMARPAGRFCKRSAKLKTSAAIITSVCQRPRYSLFWLTGGADDYSRHPHGSAAGKLPEWIAAPIPDDFWRTLQQQGLLDEAAPTPADRLI